MLQRLADLESLESLESRDCPECGAGVPFEQVGCPDGHGADCPDRVCTGCGLVLVVAPAPLAGGGRLVTAA